MLHPEVSVAGARQAQSAKPLGVSVRTLQERERGTRTPPGAARTLILIRQSQSEGAA